MATHVHKGIARTRIIGVDFYLPDTRPARDSKRVGASGPFGRSLLRCRQEFVASSPQRIGQRSCPAIAF